MQSSKVVKVISRQDILEAQKVVQDIYIDEKLIDYILKLVFATREPMTYGLNSLAKMVQYGASPRASISIVHASKAYALLQNRHFVIPDDIKIVARGILRHRIILTYHAQAENMTTDMVIDKIFDTILTP